MLAPTAFSESLRSTWLEEQGGGYGVIQRERSSFLEEVRMRRIQIGRFLSTIVLSLMASATPSAAVVIYPWCANYLGRYTLSCGSTSLKQCLATQAGNGGSCEPI